VKRLAIFLPLLIACGPFFYQAPPSLAHYPERTPTKGWRELLETAHPRSQESRDDLTTELREFCQSLSDLPKADQLKKTDEFIARNRQGQFAISVANFLLELRELIEQEIPAAEFQAYLDWRCTRLPPPSAPRPPVRNWRTKASEFLQAEVAYDRKLLEFLSSIDHRIDEASPQLQPFLITQRAGMHFRAGVLHSARLDFEELVTRYPDHPRSEVARFMLARIALNASRTLREDDFPDTRAFQKTREKLLNARRDLFLHYLKKHPKGRFANDCYGWLGGVARDENRLDDAIDYQVKRLATRPTREVTQAVMRECDQLFTELFLQAAKHGKDESLLDYRALAAHPLLAHLFLSHALDPAAQIHLPLYHDNYSGDRKTIEFLKQRIISPGAFARNTLQRLGSAMAQNSTPSDATTYLILGWAATRSGVHQQALDLFNLGLKQNITDELLHAKAVALSRLEEYLEAAKTYEELFTRFPDSTLVPPSRFDLAMAHLNSGQAGLALIIFHQLQTERENRRRRKPKSDPLYLHPDSEVPQWIDTIIQFSPVEQLLDGLNTLPPNDPSRPLLRRAVSLRAIGEERFEFARNLIIPDPAEKPNKPKRWRPNHFFDLTSERWNSDLAPLVEAHRKLSQENLSPSEQAELNLKIARHWESRRGKLSLPLHHLTDFSGSETDLLDKLRRDNALFLKHPRKTIDQALASQDELSHALKHYLAAAELAKSPDIAAPALEGANEALFRLAEFSPYRAESASSQGHNELSHQLVSRLRTEFPDRPETLRAHAFTFRPPLPGVNWLPGDRAGWIADMEIARIFYKPDHAASSKADDISQSLAGLARKDTTISEIQTTLEELDQQFQSLRPGLKPSTLIKLSNQLGDLKIVAMHHGMTHQLFGQYLPILLSKEVPPLSDDPKLPLSPFLDFLHLARTPGLKSPWSDYLARYPDGPKSEAVSLRQTRTEIRKSFPLPHVQPVFFPEAPRTTGYKHLPFLRPVGDLDKATQLLAEHRKKFPNGNYQADLDLLESALAAARNDYPRALGILTGILTDPKHPELYQDASLQFSELSLRLLVLDERPQLLRAFRENDAARDTLKKIVDADTCLARLRPFFPLGK